MSQVSKLISFILLCSSFSLSSSSCCRFLQQRDGEVEITMTGVMFSTFGGWAFRDTGRDRAQMEKESLADAIVSQEKQKVRRVRPVRSVDARTRPRLNTG